MVSTALVHLVILLAIGIVAGVLLHGYANRWLSERPTSGAGAATFALIGIAGAFLGFQMAVVLGLPSFLVPYLAAVAGAVITLVLWRGP
jgi:uncharacterized membrane protein YeaQ/YmgE (transglycosylase-associated protein family)